VIDARHRRRLFPERPDDARYFASQCPQRPLLASRHGIDVNLGIITLEKADDEFAVFLESLPMRVLRVLPDMKKTLPRSRVFPENPGVLEPGFVFKIERSHNLTKAL
jgi:hypothetical protein